MPIFPELSLSASIITTVWVGVWVVCFFNLRFGWVLSGLVVPGYLVPLAILAPWSAAVIVVEGMVTYLLIYLYSERLAPRIGLTGFFGRDRFFALVLASILVRLVFDSVLLPAIGPWLERVSPWPLDYRYDLHSFGLIVVALIANQFWKPGLIRGTVPFFVILAVTWILVRFGLMEWTNFTITSIGFLYEDMAASMLASPKAYIVIVTTAFIASRMNLNYGWDFNGILLPALLALQWYEPTKILTTFAEALLIYGVGSFLLRTPLFRDVTMEGARKLLFFFNVGFVYKILLGYTIGFVAPDVKVSDLFAFGYLLSTLIAVKMHQNEAPLRMIRATVQTSLVAVLVASVIGFSLTLLPSPFLLQAADAPRSGPDMERADSLSDLTGRAKIALYRSRTATDYRAPSVVDLERFGESVERLRAVEDPRSESASSAVALLEQMGFRLVTAPPDWLLLLPHSGADESSVFLLRTGAQDGVVSAPSALSSRHLLAAGVATARDSEWCCVAATANSIAANRRESFFHEFHRRFGRDRTLQLMLDESLRGEASGALLRVAGELPPSLDLDLLERKLGRLDVRFGGFDEALPRLTASSRYSRLITSGEALRRLRIEDLGGASDQAEPRTVDVDLDTWIRRLPIAASSGRAYRPPEVSELLLADEEVFQPALDLALRWAETRESIRQEELRTIAQSASQLGWSIAVDEAADFLLIGEAAHFGCEDCEPRHAGAYIVRLGEAAPVVYQLPSPGFDGRLAVLSTELFADSDARALFVSAVRPGAGGDGSTRLHSKQAIRSFLTLAGEVALREPRFGIDSLVQFRVTTQTLPSGWRAALALSGGRRSQALMTATERALANALEARGLVWGIVRGDDATRDLRAHRSAQIEYAEDVRTASGMVVWLDTEASDSLRESGRFTRDLLAAFDIPVQVADPAVFADGRMWAPAGESLPSALSAWLGTRDVNVMMSLADRYRLAAVTGPESGQTLLFVMNDSGAVHAIVNLDTTSVGQARRSERLDSSVLEAFVDARAGLLLPAQGAP